MIEQITFSQISSEFLEERKSRNKSPLTVKLYQQELGYFSNWLEEKGISTLDKITPVLLRSWFSDLGTHRNKGGVHCNYRIVKTCLNWVDYEYEFQDWKNPIKKVHLEPNKIPPLQEIPLTDVQKLLDVCTWGFNQLRDRAILFTLVDTGVRGSELVALNVGDINLATGSVNVNHGKGNKFRIVWLGTSGLKAVKRYLEFRQDVKPDEPLFLTDEGERLQFFGLRMMITRLCNRVEIKVYGLHCFRRCFAKTLYNKTRDIYLVSRLLGHTKIETTKRYLNIGNEDLGEAFLKVSPADCLN